MKRIFRNNGLRLAALAASIIIGSSAYADVKRVAGANCPAGYNHVTYQKASASRATYCKSLQAWDIVRLANGGSMDGSGYQCKTRASDTRKLGNSLCEKAAAGTKARDIKIEENIENIENIIDNSPKIDLLSNDMVYTIDGKKGKEITSPPRYAISSYFNNGVKYLRYEQKTGFGRLVKMSFKPVPGSANVYKSLFKGRTLHVLSKETFRLYANPNDKKGSFYAGFIEKNTAPNRLSDSVIMNQSVDIEGRKANLNLTADYVIYNSGGERRLYVTLGKSSILTAQQGGLHWDGDEKKGWFLYDVTVTMEAEALGENRTFTLLKHGPTTSPTSGSSSTTNSISLDASFNGDPPTATISQENTVTVDSTDFRAIDNTTAKKTSTRYYLAFSQDGGELKDIKDLVILRFGVRAGVAELPNRAKTGFPIISHGLWKIDKNTISVGVRLNVKATLAKMYRKSQVTGFDHRVTIEKRTVEFDNNITIPAVRLRF